MPTVDFRNPPINRRQFLNSTAKNAAGVAAGMVGLAAAGQLAKASPNERVNVAGIGIRGQGKYVTSSLASLPEVNVTAICDIDENLLPIAGKSVQDAQGKAPRFETDFRKILEDDSIDAVVVGTPDHWHALITIMACQAGKDVYVEKPVSHNVLEGVRMVEAARKHKRIVQSGIHQRSGSHFQSAIDYVRSGKLGKVRLAKAWTIHTRKSIGHKADAPVPPGVNYDMWLGPAASRPFNPNRFHYNWHWFWDYGTGEMGNWGVHMLDIARWGMGVDLPTRVSASGGKFYFNDDQQTPDTHLVHYRYDDVLITWEHRLWTNHGQEGRSAAAGFYGDKGTLVVDRGGWKVYDQKDAPTSDTSDQARTHHQNFIDCVKTRATPTSDIEIGHITSAMCHLGNVAYRVGREIEFDPTTISCPGDEEANSLLGREYRKEWELPAV